MRVDELDRHSTFLRLFLGSERELYRYVSALVPAQQDASEIVQQTALVLWEKYDEYDPDLPFTPWACRFALNVVRQWIAKNQRWKALLEHDLAEKFLARRETLKPEFDRRLQYLSDCLHKLPNDQKQMIEQYYHAQLGIEEIADQHQKSIEAVYKFLQRIRLALKNCIERKLKRRDLSHEISLG